MKQKRGKHYSRRKYYIKPKPFKHSKEFNLFYRLQNVINANK